MTAPATTDPTPRLSERLGGQLTRTEWVTIGSMTAAILALHVIGWGLLITLVAPKNLTLGSGEVFTVGLGVTAYALGMRHAFDADHIAAIDNTPAS